jgi:hypothetical protein
MKKYLLYALAAGLSLIVTFSFPQKLTPAWEMDVSFSEIFFAISSILFLGLAAHLFIKEEIY